MGDGIIDLGDNIIPQPRDRDLDIFVPLKDPRTGRTMVAPASPVINDVHDERCYPIHSDGVARFGSVSSFELQPEAEKFIPLMFGKKPKETLGRSKLLLWLFVQGRLRSEREGVARVYLYDIVDKKKADYFINIDRLINVVQKHVSNEAEVPAMFCAVFPTVIVGFHLRESVNPFQFVEFADEGELSFKILHT